MRLAPHEPEGRPIVASRTRTRSRQFRVPAAPVVAVLGVAASTASCSMRRRALARTSATSPPRRCPARRRSARHARALRARRTAESGCPFVPRLTARSEPRATDRIFLQVLVREHDLLVVSHGPFAPRGARRRPGRARKDRLRGLDHVRDIRRDRRREQRCRRRRCGRRRRRLRRGPERSALSRASPRHRRRLRKRPGTVQPDWAHVQLSKRGRLLSVQRLLLHGPALVRG